MFAGLAMPVLGRIDPERAHRLGLVALRLGLAGRAPADDATLAVEALGHRFTNPIGLAAGFDKDAVALPGLMGLGFGFVEAGTVTPLPQPGNPRPRLFRVAPQAVINRMGFNGGGLTAFLHNIEASARRMPRRTPLGVNVGVNKHGAEPERDYPALVRAVAPHADYITLNVSSPNTPGLRDLQQEDRLARILAAIARDAGTHPPLLIKLAPDLAEAAVQAVVEVAVAAQVDGLIVANTTLARPAGLGGPHAGQAGGLSGPPLRARATRMLARIHAWAAGRLTLIGCGGIANGRDALEKILAGASLVQIYTAFAYQGPALLPRLKAELAAALRETGHRSVAAAIGADAARLAEIACDT